MRKRLAVFAFALSACSLLGLGLAGASRATAPACVRQPTPLGQLQVGYCP
jgi:hypothetical protein